MIIIKDLNHLSRQIQSNNNHLISLLIIIEKNYNNKLSNLFKKLQNRKNNKMIKNKNKINQICKFCHQNKNYLKLNNQSTLINFNSNSNKVFNRKNYNGMSLNSYLLRTRISYLHKLIILFLDNNKFIKIIIMKFVLKRNSF